MIDWVGFILILAGVAQGLPVKFGSPVIAVLFDIVPHVATAEVHAAVMGSVLVLALCLLEHLQEVKVVCVRLS